jgi:fibronectin-binding autotransporter adhesin
MKTSAQLLAILTCSMLNVALVQATTNYWDINGATAGAGGATPAGTWDTGTTANWSTDSSGGIAATTWADNDDAVFSAGSDATGAFTISLSGTPVAGNLTLEEGTVTISGGTAVDIGGGASEKGIIDVFPNSTLTIDSVIAGGNEYFAISKGSSSSTGTGTLVLNGDNTYFGQTTLYVGTLSFDSIGDVGSGASALGNPLDEYSGAIVLSAGFEIPVTLKYTGSGHSTDRRMEIAGPNTVKTNIIDASGSGPLVFTGGTNITSTTAGTYELRLAGTNTGENKLAGKIHQDSGVIRFAKIEPGTWVLTGESDFWGVCDIREGTLVVNALANANVASPIGTGQASGAHTVIGLGGNSSDITNATLKYIGSGHSTDRQLRLYGLTNRGGGVIDASGTGPLVLNGSILRTTGAQSYDKTLILKGSHTGTNTVNGIIQNGNNGKVIGVTKEGAGAWVLAGVNEYAGATTVNEGTLLVNSPGSLAAGSAVTVNSGATFGGSGVVNGPVTIAAGATLAPGASVGTLTLSSDLVLSGDLFIELNKSHSPSNDVVAVAGVLTNAGTGWVIVTNLGPALVLGDSFRLFNKALLNGGAMAIVSSGGVVWTNKLAVDGSIVVLSTGTPPSVPATNLTIMATGPTSFSLGAMGAANSAYGVYFSTNIMTPMTNWWLIGTTNSDAGGIIQFLDSQATNEQRFYRFGQ